MFFFCVKWITNLQGDEAMIKNVYVQSLVHQLLNLMDGKILIFFHYKTQGDTLAQLLKVYGLTYVRIDGDNKASREKDVKKFKTDKDCQIALISYNSGSMGFTFGYILL